MTLALAAIHPPDACGSAGIAFHSNEKLASVSSEKTTPAMAAAFGVFNPASVRPSIWLMPSTLAAHALTGRAGDPALSFSGGPEEAGRAASRRRSAKS